MTTGNAPFAGSVIAALQRANTPPPLLVRCVRRFMSSVMTRPVRHCRLSEAFVSLAVLALVKEVYDLDWAGAYRVFKRAIELNPPMARLISGMPTSTFAPRGTSDRALTTCRE